MQHQSAPPGPDRTLAGAARRGRPTRARRRPESGAALIEAALILPVLMVFLLGIIEFGLVYATGATATGSSRSGVRLAAATYAPNVQTTNTANLQAATDQIAAAVTADLKSLTSATPVGMTIYKVDPASTSGAPLGGWPGKNVTLTGGCSTNCVRYVWNNTTKTMTYSSGTWSKPAACGTNIDSIGVYVLIKHHYLTKLLGSDRYVDGKTVMRIEPLPTEQCA